MKTHTILLFIFIILLTGCSQDISKWKTIEIENICKFEIPQKLECNDDNEFIKHLEINKETNYCKVTLDEKKANKHNVLTFKTEKESRIPYKISISVDQKEDFSERYTETIMNIADYAIPYLEKNLLNSYMKLEGINDSNKKYFDWMPIKIVEKSGIRFAVIEYKMQGPNKNLVRAVHSIFLFDGKRVMFSIYCNEKYLNDSEEYFMRFIESISFKNLVRNDYCIYSDINTKYTFQYPLGFDLNENFPDYINLGYSHTVRLRTKENTIDISFYEDFNNNTTDEAKKIFKSMYNKIKFYNVSEDKYEVNGCKTIYFDFDTNEKEYFKGNGVVIKDMSTIIVNAILDEEYEDIGNNAMTKILSSIKINECTYDCYIP